MLFDVCYDAIEVHERTVLALSASTKRAKFSLHEYSIVNCNLRMNMRTLTAR